jgi:hypothetical protein
MCGVLKSGKGRSVVFNPFEWNDACVGLTEEIDPDHLDAMT